MARPIVHAHRRASSHQVLCPYCRSSVDQDTRTAVRSDQGSKPWRCPRCLTLHHTACMLENGGCTLFGCGESAPEPPAPPGSRLPLNRTPAEPFLESGWGRVLSITARTAIVLFAPFYAPLWPVAGLTILVSICGWLAKQEVSSS